MIPSVGTHPAEMFSLSLRLHFMSVRYGESGYRDFSNVMLCVVLKTIIQPMKCSFECPVQTFFHNVEILKLLMLAFSQTISKSHFPNLFPKTIFQTISQTYFPNHFKTHLTNLFPQTFPKLFSKPFPKQIYTFPKQSPQPNSQTHFPNLFPKNISKTISQLFLKQIFQTHFETIS